MRDPSSADRDRAEDYGPDQREQADAPQIAWPGADAESWPGADADDPDAPGAHAPIRDETHVAVDEPHVTPPGEPEWPADEPGPTAELPAPPAEATRVMRPVPESAVDTPDERGGPSDDADAQATGTVGEQIPTDLTADGRDQDTGSADATSPGLAAVDRTADDARPQEPSGEDTRPALPADRTPAARLPSRVPAPWPHGSPAAPQQGPGLPPRPAETTRVVRPALDPQARRTPPAERPGEQTRVVRPADGRPAAPQARRTPPAERPGEQTRVVRPAPDAHQARRTAPAEQTMIVRPADAAAAARPAACTQQASRTQAADDTGSAAATPPAKTPPPDDAGGSAPGPRRRRTGMVVAVAAVVVVALAAGVVFAVPGLAERLGLVGSDAVAVAPPPDPVRFEPALSPADGGGSAPTPDGVAKAIAGPAADPDLGTLTGVVIDPVTGQTLFSQDAATALVPASTTKILSTAAVLLALPHTEQLVTKVVAGDEPGTAIIVGGGDPTLSSLPVGRDSVFPGAAHLDELVEQVKAAGPVERVMVDLNRYTGDNLARGWLPADVPAGHITPIVPAMLDAGRQDPTKAVSPRSGNPARALAEEFARRVGATVPADAVTTAKPDARVLGEVKSAPIAELVDTALLRSDNVLAETLIRELAIATGQEPSFSGATAAVEAVLRDNGFDVGNLVLRDGSGMSTENRVTAALLGEVLRAAAAPEESDPRAAKLRPLLAGLPVAGGSGTLDGRYRDGPSAAGKGWVRAKTGTLSAVNSLAGVVLDTDGRLLVFALMSNGTNPLDARPALDAVAAALRKCGCR